MIYDITGILPIPNVYSIILYTHTVTHYTPIHTLNTHTANTTYTYTHLTLFTQQQSVAKQHAYLSINITLNNSTWMQTGQFYNTRSLQHRHQAHVPWGEGMLHS